MSPAIWKTTKPLETPAQAKRRQVRDSIIAAAEAVFAKEGADGLSIRRLGEEIDYSPSAIYKYFSSKSELIEVLQEAFFENLVGKLNAAKADMEDYPKGEMSRICMGIYIGAALERPHHYAAAFSGSLEADTANDILQQMAEGTGSFRNEAFFMLSGLVQENIDAGAFRQDLRIVQTAKSLWASMHGCAMLMIHMPAFGTHFPDGTEMTHTEFIDFHADLIIRGLEA